MSMFDLFFLKIVICTIGLVSAECPDGFEHHGDKCYKVAALDASWIEAKWYCQLLGGILAVVNNQTEQNLLDGMITKYHGSHINEVYWLAGSDTISERDWRWMPTDGVSRVISGFTNWGPTRPDNVGGNENCLVLVYARVMPYWDDVVCHSQHSFICETAYRDDTNVNVFTTATASAASVPVIVG